MQHNLIVGSLLSVFLDSVWIGVFTDIWPDFFCFFQYRHLEPDSQKLFWKYWQVVTLETAACDSFKKIWLKAANVSKHLAHH